ncbi:TniQ family protein [Peribacillus sp. SCS-155]|uniref:TniQ family protein n=1 Tax=Peribacillus sedimenti TaxID=3115297 RepID=UPI003906CF89
MRPPLMPGESMSGYLLRLCSSNHIKISSLLNQLKEKTIGRRNEFLLDVFPEDLISILHLSMYTTIPSESLIEHTFGVAFQKLYGSQRGSKLSFIRDISQLMVKDCRRFCIKCLEEKGIYKLIWQVKDILFCDIHVLPLEHKCVVCGEAMPYLHDSLIDYTCPNCHESFLQMNQSVINDSHLLDMQKSIYHDWRFLLNPARQLTCGIAGFSTQQSLAIGLLFMNSTVENSQYGPSTTIPYLKRLFNNNKRKRSVLLSDLITLKRQFSISIEDFSSLKVDTAFVESVTRVTEAKSTFGPCLSPWCKQYGVNTGMKKVLSDYKRFKTRYFGLSVCTSCNIRYGYNRGNEKWEDVQNKIDSIKHTLSVLERGLSFPNITRRADIIGYLLYHRLLSNKVSARFPIRQLPIESIEYFYSIYEGSTSFWKLYKNCRQKSDWSPYEIAFYLSGPAVQYELNFSKFHKRKKQQEMIRTVEHAIQRNIIELQTESKHLTLSDVSASLGKRNSFFWEYDLTSEVRESIESHNKKIRVAEADKLSKLIDVFFKQPVSAESYSTVSDLYNFLGVNRNYIRRNFIELEQYISLKMKQRRRQYNQIKINSWTKLLVEAAEDLIRHQIPPTTENLARETGISSSTIRRYPEIMNHIRSRLSNRLT